MVVRVDRHARTRGPASRLHRTQGKSEINDGLTLDDFGRSCRHAIEVLLEIGGRPLVRLCGAGFVLEHADARSAIRRPDEVVGDEPVDTSDELLHVVASIDELVDQLGAAVVVTDDYMHLGVLCSPGDPPFGPAASCRCWRSIARAKSRDVTRSCHGVRSWTSIC